MLLAHPGGPFWQRKDDGAWTVIKGEIGAGEQPLETAQREFEEETGIKPDGPFLELTPIQQRGGKVVAAWAFQGDCDPSQIRSNSFAMEWPPRSGQMREFPEIDRAAFFDPEEARRKINPAQAPLIEELSRKLASRSN